MELILKLSSFDDIKQFIEITSRYGDTLSLQNGGYVVDARSILGIFSMDLSQPVHLQCEGENDELKRELSPFIAA